MQGNIELFGSSGKLFLDGTEFLFDRDDIALMESRDWYRDKDGYLVSCYYFNGQRRFVRFHRIVMHAEPNQVVDHINKNRADNRKENLRCCDRGDSSRNRGVYSNNTSGVTGVFFDKQRNRWIASITYESKKLLIGRFVDKDEAIRARLSKEIELFKEFAPQRELYEKLLQVEDGYGHINQQSCSKAS